MCARLCVYVDVGVRAGWVEELAMAGAADRGKHRSMVASTPSLVEQWLVHAETDSLKKAASSITGLPL